MLSDGGRNVASSVGAPNKALPCSLDAFIDM